MSDAQLRGLTYSQPVTAARPLVLASTSRYRRALLGRLGVDFEVASPGVDESQWRDRPPATMARELAVAKAEALAASYPGGALIIGSDQVAVLDDEVLGKPGTAERAVEQLRRMAGRQHQLITAVAVHDVASGETLLDVDVHTLLMRSLTPALLAAYVAHDVPLDCAGSYKLEGRGIALFERIEADPEIADDTAIVGLPLLKLCRLLRRFGVDVLAG